MAMPTGRNAPTLTLLSSSEETRTSVAAGMEKGTKTHVQKYQKLEGLLRNDVKCLLDCANKMNYWLKCKLGFEVMNKEVEWYKRLCSAIEPLEQILQANPSDSVDQVWNRNGAQVSFGELIKPKSEVVEEGELGEGCAEAEIVGSGVGPAAPVPNQKIAAGAVDKQEIERGRVQCQYCHLQFSCREHLSAHMEAHHIDNKPFNCTICQRSFAFSQSLRTHMGTHVDTTGTGHIPMDTSSPPMNFIPAGQGTSGPVVSFSVAAPSTTMPKHSLREAAPLEDNAAKAGAKVSTEKQTEIWTRKQMQNLVKSVDPNAQLDEDVEDFLMNYAEEYMETIVKGSALALLAVDRNSTALDVKDVQTYLERAQNSVTPGFGTEEPRPYKKLPLTEAHKQRTALIKKTLKKY